MYSLLHFYVFLFKRTIEILWSKFHLKVTVVKSWSEKYGDFTMTYYMHTTFYTCGTGVRMWHVTCTCEF